MMDGIADTEQNKYEARCPTHRGCTHRHNETGGVPTQLRRSTVGADASRQWSTNGL